jgi:predicted transposase YdaD
LLDKCEALKGYSAVIEKAREMEDQTHDRAEAIKGALDWCIDNGILVQYLKIKGSEVENMLLTEWNTEDAIRVRSQEAWEDGRNKGRSEGRNEGVRIGEQRSAATIAAQEKRIAELERQLSAKGKRPQ